MKRLLSSAGTTSTNCRSSYPRISSLILLLLLSSLTTKRTDAFITVAVELVPYTGTSTPSVCSSTFIKNFESNLTAWVVNATRSISFLSDFKAPGGFHLTYFNNGTRRVRHQQRALTTTSCTKCNSASCSLSCAIGVCNLCAGSRRFLVEEEEDEEDAMERKDQTIKMRMVMGEEAEIQDPNDAEESMYHRRRVQTADWSTVGTSVTRSIKPTLIYYGSVYAGGCLGDTNRLSVNVTYLSNVPIDSTMTKAIVLAFGVPAPAPANAPTACCSMDFMSCVNYCGTTPTQCQTCGAVDVGWMPKGPPAPNSCTTRWNNCVNNVNGCCPGLQCIGDQYWKGCFYVPP